MHYGISLCYNEVGHPPTPSSKVYNAWSLGFTPHTVEPNPREHLIDT